MAYLQLVIGPPLAAMAPDPVLVWDAVFLDEGPINMRPDDLAGGDGHSVGLVETRDQSGKRHPYMCKGGQCFPCLANENMLVSVETQLRLSSNEKI